MLCDQILNRIDPDAVHQAIDWLDLTWFDCTQRALRKQTRGGVQVRILLPVGQYPRHGDVLSQHDAACVAVNLLPTVVLVAHPSSRADMGRLALELGNLHVPVEVSGNDLILIPDGPVEAILARNGIGFERMIRRFVPERSSVSAMPARAADFQISMTNAGDQGLRLSAQQ